jgi:phospholipid/cholesterol/gamma-HCH transport system substrate-binding protein
VIQPKAALWRLVVAGVATLIVFIVLMNVLRQPVAAETRSYTAQFVDVSGLHIDADVRVRGVRVGKVKSLALERSSGQSTAAVGFTLDKRYAVVSGARLAIKYQALTGLRYLDVVNPSQNASAATLVTDIPVSMTQPSFDITTLFNGLQPVIATLSPEEIDTFTENAATYLSGEGGLKPMLESIRKLTEFASNRQEVIATLMRNLDAVADVFGGHSKDFVEVLDGLNKPVDAAISVIDEFRKSELYGPKFTSLVLSLLANAGFPRGAATRVQSANGRVDVINPAVGNIADGLDSAITRFDDYSRDVLKLIPVMWDNVGPPSLPDVPVPCSRGPAQLPDSMDVLLNGQRVILCHR